MTLSTKLCLGVNRERQEARGENLKETMFSRYKTDSYV